MFNFLELKTRACARKERVSIQAQLC